MEKMNWLYKLLGLKPSLSKIRDNQEIKNNEVPVSQSLELKTHQETVAKEFNFLITEFGFERSFNEFVSREFWTVYSKDSIDIEIMYETGSLPFVAIRNKDLPYDESKQLDNRDNIELFNLKARQIRDSRIERSNPKHIRFLDEWLNKGNLYFSELNQDYEQFGQQEHIEFLKEAAFTVKQNLAFKKGKLSEMH